jgi:hypothetical protein
MGAMGSLPEDSQQSAGNSANSTKVSIFDFICNAITVIEKSHPIFFKQATHF